MTAKLKQKSSLATAVEQRMAAEENAEAKTPEVLSARVGDLAPLVAKWKQEHHRVPQARLVEDALKLYFKAHGYAGKRYAHLVEGV